ncbi:MAG: regulatory protein RecX [Steroidobacteraceae bacterium]
MAIGLLARREYATGELSAVLGRKGYSREAIQAAVEELAGERLLDDVRYAASLVRVLTGRGQGPSRIRQELAAAALPAGLIESALAESGQDWAALAREVRRRKFGQELPSAWPERARQMRFLQYRGFSTDHIASALGGSGADDTDP